MTQSIIKDPEVNVRKGRHYEKVKGLAMRKLAKAILAIISETKKTTEVVKVNKAVNEEVARLTNRLTLRLQSQHLG